METCRMCGARLSNEEELGHHNELMHPNVGRKGGEVEVDKERKPERDRPID